MAWWTDEDVSFYRGKSCVVCYEDTGKGVVTYIKAFDNSVSAKKFLKEWEAESGEGWSMYLDMDFFVNDDGIRGFLELHKDAITPTTKLN